MALLFLSKGHHHFAYLPHIGQKDVHYEKVNGKSVADTIYHTVSDFKLVNQDGDTVTMADFKGKILVVDFFFTRCGSICPIMSSEMENLQWQLNDPAYNDVHFLSHTVDPEHDTPAVLKKYGEEHHADFKRWTFLTGPKKEIYEMGVKQYLVPAQEDALAPGGFLHSNKFILVDKDRHIRGMYNGTDPDDIRNLVADIKMLKKEQLIKEHNADQS